MLFTALLMEVPKSQTQTQPPLASANSSPEAAKEPGRRITVGVCCMDVKGNSKPMHAILSRLEAFGEFKIVMFGEKLILNEPIEKWPQVDCLIGFHSKGFPLAKAVEYW